MKTGFFQRVADSIDNISLRIQNPAQKARQFNEMMVDLAAGERSQAVSVQDIAQTIEMAVQLQQILWKKRQEGITPSGFSEALIQLERGLDIASTFADGDLRLMDEQTLKAQAADVAKHMSKHPFVAHEVRRAVREV